MTITEKNSSACQTASLVVHPSRRWLFRFMAAGMSILSLVALLEVLALTKLVDYRLVFATPYGKAWENPRNRLDHELIHVHQPYESFEGDIRGDLARWFDLDTGRRYSVSVKYDHQGFRNATDMASADMVIVGDSFVEGPIVLRDEISSARLATSLGCQVLNLGQSGYAPQQELVALRRYGFSMNPKVVVWVIFEGNDLTHDFRRYEYNIKDWDQFVSRTHGYRKRSFSRNLLSMITRLMPARRRSQNFGLNRSGTLTGIPHLEGERMYFGYNATKLGKKDMDTVEAGLDVVGQAFQACQDRGISFLLAFAPIKYRVYRDMCIFEPGTKAANWIPSSLNTHVSRWAQANQIAYLDLTEALHAKAKKGQLVYFLDDGHWNANGHAAVAEAVESFIRNRDWLQKTP